MMDTGVPVVVLKIHHGSLGIARSLGRLGIHVHALTGTPEAPAALSRYWRDCHRWDIEGSPAERSLEYLLRLGRRLGRPAVLIAVSDHTALFVAEHARALSERFIFPALSRELVGSLISKKEMYLLAKRLDIPTPETAFPGCRSDVVAFLERATFPVVLKAIDGAALKARAGCTMAIAQDAAELLALYDRLEDAQAPNLMLQEYIPGGEDSVWMFNGYFDAASECLAGFTGRKLRQNPVYSGSTSLGICLPNAEVERTTLEFMKAIGYRGILDIGYRYDARDGRYKVLDVNPRIGSSFRLFVDANGLDVARALYLHLTGQAVPQPAPAHGRKWMVEDQDLESCVRYWRDGRLGAREWALSFRGVREAAWFARDDLRPFLAMACELGMAGLAWARRRAGARWHAGRPIPG
jgi:D-aspartate ligase